MRDSQLIAKGKVGSTDTISDDDIPDGIRKRPVMNGGSLSKVDCGHWELVRRRRSDTWLYGLGLEVKPAVLHDSLYRVIANDQKYLQSL